MIKEQRLIMGMPITIMTPAASLDASHIEEIFDFFRYVDTTYSPFIETSDVSRINNGSLIEKDYTKELRSILSLAETTKQETKGYFDVWHRGIFDPSGIVKGWAIEQASKMMGQHTSDFYIEAGGDIQVSGANADGKDWKIGVRNPFNRYENISVVSLNNHAIATSGTAIRGQHIYDPVQSKELTGIVSLSIIARNIIDADRMATAAFAMGSDGINFIESLPGGYEGYMVSKSGVATMTSRWKEYEASRCDTLT